MRIRRMRRCFFVGRHAARILGRRSRRPAAGEQFPSLCWPARWWFAPHWPALLWPALILPGLIWLRPVRPTGLRPAGSRTIGLRTMGLGTTELRPMGLPTDDPRTMGLRPGGAAATRSAAPEAKMAMQLTSPAIGPNQSIPPRFTCSGADVSPPLRWAGAPAETQSFALLVRDRDAHDFTHWAIWNLPARLRGLPENLANGPAAAGGVQGMNSWQALGYGGPCPPPGAAHHYVFTLYALRHQLALPAGAGSGEVLAAMQGIILARAQMVATFGR